MASSNEYAEKVVKAFIEDITDHIFLNIQNNEELMREYQTQVHLNSLQSVNTTIGKKVKEILDLDDTDESKDPKSWLIKSYTKHSK